MSTTIFKVKVNHYENKQMDTETFMDYCLEFPPMDFDYRKYIELLSLKLEKNDSPRSMSYKRFFELLKMNHELSGDSFFEPLLKEFEEEFMILKESYINHKISVLSHPNMVIWNNTLADLKVMDFKPLPVLELKIEIAQDESGIVAFPNHRGLGVQSAIYREFMIRILIDIQQGMNDSSETIYNWFKERNGEPYPDYLNSISYGEGKSDFYGDEGIIWGISQDNEITIQLNDTDFKEQFKGEWWLDRIASNFDYWRKNDPEWSETNKDYPFKIKEFTILVHPAWFPAEPFVLDLSQIYDSTAY